MRRWLAIAFVLSACSGSAPHVAPASPPAPPPQAPALPPPAPEITLEEDPPPEGAPCDSTEACGEGEHCRGPAGCGLDWACGAPRECGAATVSYCGCDGLTFYARESCPGRPYAQLGPCEALGEAIEAPEEGDEVAGNAICTGDDDCRAGFVCAGVAGCGTYWTCVRRRALRCTRERVALCACDGETFFSSPSCPGRPIAHAGYCAGDEPEVAVAQADAVAQPPERASAERANEAAPTSAPACTSDRDCPRGQACTGGEGCDTEWRCAPRRTRCVSDTQHFCGCDGQSFRGSMTCPGRPYRHRGSCEAD